MSMFPEQTVKELKNCTAAVRRNIERRFLGKDSILYDYAGLNGEISLPTPEECRRCQPNALGWWSPIENGGFFNGDYVLGLLAGYEKNKDESMRNMVRRLISGLFRLQDVCKIDGCIARGIGSDGECHFPASSNDQVIPWMLALWKYRESDIPSPAEKEECKARLLRQLHGLKANHWIIPGDIAGFARGSFLTDENDLEIRLSSVHIAIATAILAELESGDALAEHEFYLNEKLKNGKSRIDLLEEGFPELAAGHCWFTSHSIYALRELYRRTADPVRKEKYRNAISVTARAAAAFISLYASYQPGLFFTPDWRLMLSAWMPQTSSMEAQECAVKEIKIWNNVCPAIRNEKYAVMGSLTAAWIVTLSEDSALIEKSLPDIIQAVRYPDYDKLHYGAFYYAENVVNEILAQGFS